MLRIISSSFSASHFSFAKSKPKPKTKTKKLKKINPSYDAFFFTTHELKVAGNKW